MRAVVFANGLLSDPEGVRVLLQPGDLLIAADGGSRHALALGLTPDILVGDLDSLDEKEVSHLESSGVEMIRHPAHKDFTDLELALHVALERGAAEVLVFGALGARWDQTLANLLLPAAAGLQGCRIALVDSGQEIRLIRGGETLQVHGRPGDTLSLIPLSGDAHGVTTERLEYPLHGETLLFGATRGISNVLLGEIASVAVVEGLLLCVVIHQAMDDRR